MNRTNEPMRREASRDHKTALPPVCPACGEAARREAARFCSTCGRSLREHTYEPADSLLASYHQQYSRPAMLLEQKTGGARLRRQPRSQVFASEGNTSASIALVLVFSALVPFVGILFCPLAILFGGFGLFEAWLVPRVGGVRLSACCISFGFLIGGAQFLLLSIM